MKKIIFTLALILSGLLPTLRAQTTCKEVVGYYPAWQWYDRAHLVAPATIQYSKYSILNYAFFNPQANGTIVGGDSWADENLLLGQINWNSNPVSYYPNTSLVDLAHNNNVKVLISVGGWTWSDNFPTIAASPTLRATFAHECNRLVSFYNLDGIDIDWEYPGFAAHSGGPADVANFTLFLQEIRDSLNALENQTNEQYLLTAAVGASAANMANVQWNNVAPLLDMINLMSYDFFGAWDGVANHNSPLGQSGCGDPGFNITSAFQVLTQQYNVAPGKINIGIAFYGRSQTGFTGLCQSTSGNAATTAFPPDGVPLYYELAPQLSQYTTHWDAQAQVPWLSGNGVFVSYDDEQSIALKAQFINSNGARGAIIWEITGDYIETSPGSGVIGSTPLIDTLNAVFCAAPLGNLDLQSTANFSVQPNPAQDQLQLTFSENTTATRIQFIDITGRCVSTILPSSSHQTRMDIDTHALASGTYICLVEFASGHQVQQRVVIAH